MEVNFTLSLDDWSRFQRLSRARFLRKHGKFSTFNIVRHATGALAGGAIGAFYILLREHPEIACSIKLFGAVAGPALLAALTYPQIMLALSRKYMISPDGWFLSPQTVRISAHGVAGECAAGLKYEIPWSSIRAFEQDTHNYYLYVDAMQAHILPRAAAVAVGSLLEERLSAVKGKV